MTVVFANRSRRNTDTESREETVGFGFGVFLEMKEYQNMDPMEGVEVSRNRVLVETWNMALSRSLLILPGISLFPLI